MQERGVIRPLLQHSLFVVAIFLMQLVHYLTHSHITTPLDGSGKTLWEKEKLLVQAISPFPTMFSTLSKQEIIIFVTSNVLSANAFNLVRSKILSCENETCLILLFFHQHVFPCRAIFITRTTMEIRDFKSFFLCYPLYITMVGIIIIIS